MTLAHWAAIRLSACLADGSEWRQPRYMKHCVFVQAKIPEWYVWSCCLASLDLGLFCVIKIMVSAAVCSRTGVFTTLLWSYTASVELTCVFFFHCREFWKYGLLLCISEVPLAENQPSFLFSTTSYFVIRPSVTVISSDVFIDIYWFLTLDLSM